MTATKIDTPELIEGHRSHWVELDAYASKGIPLKVEVFPKLETSWRGQPVIVHMNCDRYRASFQGEGEKLTDWRVYAHEARIKTDEPYRYGDHVSDLARRRLGDACKPIVMAWLESPEYAESERQAYVRALVRELKQDRVSDDAHRVRGLIPVYAERIGQRAAAQLVKACNAFDAYQKALTDVQ